MHLSTSTAGRPRRRVLLAGVVGLLTAGLLAPPAMADGHGAWPMVGSDPANTRQAVTSLPTDPGLRWTTDLTEVATTAAPDGYQTGGQSAHLDPIGGPDGLVLQLATNPANFGRPALVGLDAASGAVELEIQGLLDRCAPGVDSQGRIWVGLRNDADPATSTNVVRAFDAAGDPIPGTDIELAESRWCDGNLGLHLGGDDERLVLFRGQFGSADVRGYDIGTTPPSLAFELDDSSGFDAWLGSSPGNTPVGASGRIAAFSDDTMLLPVRVGTQARLLFVDLGDGSIDREVTLPVRTVDGMDRDVDQAGFVVAVADEEAVVSITDRGDVAGLLHGVPLAGTSTTVVWTQQLPSQGGVTTSGASLLGITGSTVVAPSLGVLEGYDRSTNQPTAWSGDPATTANLANLIVDAQGRMATTYQPTAGAFSIVVYNATGAPMWEVNRNTLVEGATGSGQQLKLGSVTADGALIVRIGSVLTAIDDSGGLADCVLPFGDVTLTNVHRESICRLVQREITGGVSADEYAPGRSVTREQMASFLARALGLEPSTNARFDDVSPTSVHAGNINAIADAGITLGRGGGIYDPSGTVTRAEMASFLARAAGLQGTSGTTFTDVDAGNVHTPNIYAVLEAGITTGRTATTYAPTEDVRRDQMASFLIRMVDLLDGTS